jgi:hypothetical protein
VTNNAGTFCAGNIAQVSFRWALCACTDVKFATGNFSTDAFDSSLAQRDGGLGASVGANSQLSGDSFFDVGGYVWSGGSSAFGNVASPNSRVRQDFKSNGQATGSGSVVVDHDAYINGDVQTKMSIAGKLYVPPSAAVGPNVTAAGGIDRSGPVVISQPCDCSPNQLIDIAGIVEDGKLNNDNALIGLDPTAFENAPGPRRLDLNCGRYYLTKITPRYSSTIAVHGRTALFIGGSLDTQQANLDIAIDPQAELDLFFGGTIVNATGLRMGNIDVPAQFRVYIAGSPVNFSAPSVTAGNFYLPYSDFVSPSNLDLYGSIFAKSFTGQGRIHYDRGVLNAGVACERAPPAPDGGPPPDAGAPASCTSCRDCGNQACVGGKCGACTSAADCCAPLQCIGGSCQARLN